MEIVKGANANVPIIGQPRILEYFVTILVKCPCGQVFQLVGLPGSMRACPGNTDRTCNKIYRLNALPVAFHGEGGKPIQGEAPIIVNEQGNVHVSLAIGVGSNEPPQV